MSELKDKTIICKDCGQEFIFSVRDQEFYAEKGFQNEPQRCKDCRAAKKAQRNSGSRNENR
ncbi:MAG: zinc-ribbon domain-containing protein [Bacilli bacterium]